MKSSQHHQHKQQEQQMQKEQQEQQKQQEQQEKQEQLQRQKRNTARMKLSCFHFWPCLVSLPWCKDHDVNQLVNKFEVLHCFKYYITIYNQNRMSQRKMEGWSSKCCKYHVQNPANTTQHEWKGLSSKCHRCHAERDVPSPQCRFTLPNAENMTNTTQTLLFVSFLFWLWWFRQFSFLALKSFTDFLAWWLCLCSPVHRNQSHNRKETTNTA